MIVAGQRLSDTPIACEGLLLIGDPHVSSRRPGRRKDPEWPSPILRKLERCVAIANERNLLPVFLGDLFEHPVERDVALKARLIRILKQFRLRPLANVGNHDIAHTTLSDGDSLAVLGLADVIDIAALSGPACEVQIGARRIGIGLTPFGQDIPDDVGGAFGEADAVLWLTHHDIAFDAAYPGAVPPFAISGCDLVVNGHVHATKEPIRVGSTLWTNPGNINRRSVDLIGQTPCAWIMAADGRLQPKALPHEQDVFDLTGRIVQPASGRDLANDVESAFVSLLQAEASTELSRSGDGGLLAEEIEAKFARDETSDSVRAIIRSLLAEAVEGRGAGS
jgi:hypothetical protein